MEENEFQEPSFGEIVELIQQYEQAVETRRNVFFDEENFEQIIRFYEENREFNKALRVIESAIEMFPYSGFFHSKKAEILANQKRFNEALLSLDIAQKLDPTDINIFLIRADVYLWEGRYADAMAEVDYAMSLATLAEDKCELCLELADIYEDQEKFTDVVRALKDALSHNPQSEEALNRYWFCTELMQTYEESIKFHEELINESPYSYLAWFNLGHAYAGLGQYEKSLEAFEYVIAIDENFDAAYTCCADVLYNMEEFEESLKYYLDAIKISKPNKELYLKTGECFERLEDFSKARAYYRKSLSIDPCYSEAFYKLGDTYRFEENWFKAVSSYERAVKLMKDNVDYLLALAEAYMNVDEAMKALEIFERIFQLEPQVKQHWINLATAYYNAGNFRKAFQVLTEAELKYENNADIFYIKAIFYWQIGNRHEALLNLERGLLVNFEEHTMLFEMDESLLDNELILQVIEQYRN